MHREHLVIKAISPDGTNKQTLVDGFRDLLIGADNNGFWHLRESSPGLWFYDFATQQTQLAHALEGGMKYIKSFHGYPTIRLGWYVGKEAIYCVSWNKDIAGIDKINKVTGEKEQIAQLNMDVYGISFSPDEERILFANFDFQSADLMLVTGLHL